MMKEPGTLIDWQIGQLGASVVNRDARLTAGVEDLSWQLKKVKAGQRLIVLLTILLASCSFIVGLLIGARHVF